jgi:hypothetical protein
MQTYYLIVLEVKNSKWVSLGENQGVRRAAFPPGSSRKMQLSCLFHLLGVAPILWLMAPSSPAKPVVAGRVLFTGLTLASFSTSPFPYKGPCDSLRSPR